MWASLSLCPSSDRHAARTSNLYLPPPPLHPASSPLLVLGPWVFAPSAPGLVSRSLSLQGRIGRAREMGASSKSKRRKLLAVEAKKAKRAKLEKALSSLAAFSIPNTQLDNFDRNLVRERKHQAKGTGDGRKPAELEPRENDGGSAGSSKAELLGPSGDVCGIEDVVLPEAKKPASRKPAGNAGKQGKGTSAARAASNAGAGASSSRGVSSGTADRRGSKPRPEPKKVEREQVPRPKQIAVERTEDDDVSLLEDDERGRGSTLESEMYDKAATVKSGQFVVHVSRDEEIEESRSQLPICGMEQEIMEAVNYNSVVLICGETGSGKTTQIPQFLYEAGYGSKRTRGQIGVTQPRRIAASSTAQRVAQELGSPLGDIVGYQVRYDKKLGDATAVKFMTDGILMRELQGDALLRKYSVVVLDEVHERNLNTDVILGFLTRIIPLRAKLATNPKSGVEELKLLIMSATLSAKEFVENKRLFKVSPPVVSVPAKRFPVTIHFSRKTELHSYLDVAYKKISAIHRKLPNGGILVFVTGQREVLYLTKRLQKRLCKGAGGALPGALSSKRESREGEEEEEGEGEDLNPFDGDAAEDFSSEEEDSETDGEDDDPANDKSSDVESSSDREELEGTIKGDQGNETEKNGESPRLDAIVIPLYAKLGPEAQSRAFTKPPANCRQIIIATNVAETSITIPGIRYVVDTGRSKQKTVKSVDSGLTHFEVDWISKSSATQRAGRAGRTGPGHCYRLFSSAFYNDNFPQYSLPDIRNTPLEAVVLQLKSIGVDKSESFPFPTQPNSVSLSRAERCLRLLNAVDTDSGQINALGKFLSKFPVNPRHARMLVASVMLCTNPKLLGKCLQAAISVAAILSFENPVAHQKAEVTPEAGDKAKSGGPEDDGLSRGSLSTIAQRYGGDVFATLVVVRAYEEEVRKNPSQMHAFCQKNGIHITIIREIVQLKKQLATICAARVRSEEDGSLREHAAMRAAVEAAGGRIGLQDLTPRPGAQICTVLQHAICVGWADRVARRVTVNEMIEERESRNQVRSTLKTKKRYQTMFGDALVSLRRKSSIGRNRPEFVVYRDLIQGAKHVNMERVTEVLPSWLSEVLRPIATFSSPLEDPQPSFSPKADTVLCWVHPTVGKHDWSLPICQVEAKDKATRCRAFLAALISGKVFPDFSKDFGRYFRVKLDYAGVGSSNHPGVIMALHTLEKYNVSTRRSFARAACLKKNFLLEDFLKCTQRGDREDFAVFWPKFCDRVSGAG